MSFLTAAALGRPTLLARDRVQEPRESPLTLRGLSIANLTRPAERISRFHNYRGEWKGLRPLPTARIAGSGILPVDQLIAEGHRRFPYLGIPVDEAHAHLETRSPRMDCHRPRACRRPGAGLGLIRPCGLAGCRAGRSDRAHDFQPGRPARWPRGAGFDFGSTGVGIVARQIEEEHRLPPDQRAARRAEQEKRSAVLYFANTIGIALAVLGFTLFVVHQL